MSDHKIVYVVWSKGYGVDGRDPSDKPRPLGAFWDEQKANACVNPWKEVKVELISFSERQAEARKKLDPIDRLVLGID